MQFDKYNKFIIKYFLVIYTKGLIDEKLKYEYFPINYK